MRKTYFLPTKLKKELRKIWGMPVFNGKEKVTRKFKKLIQEKKFKNNYGWRLLFFNFAFRC